MNNAKRILIVDDDEELCHEMSIILEDEGYAVEVVFDGLRGKKHVEQERYDVILLDVKMPGLNGLVLLQDMKQKKNGAKVILVTGSLHLNRIAKNESIAVDSEESVLRMADGLISKPFDVEMVLDKIKELIE